VKLARRLATLRRLQRLRKLERDRLAASATESGRVLEQAQRMSAQVQAELDAMHADFARQVGSIRHPRELELIGDEHDIALAALAETHQSISRAHRAHDQRRADLVRAEGRLAVTETLVSRSRDALRRAADRSEQATLDDLAPTRKKASP